ncbi:ATP-binding response regulator [Flavobacterium sp. P21]|uniref:ATP-binding response regulator n=1 Tax=Flavobacterium sp. P21 TaxID=3423948 RepID=UPI003D66A4FD
MKSDGNRIPENLKNKIFEPFFRAPDTTSITGTGIGLSLSHSLAELHSGTLKLDTAEKQYNSFVLELQLHQEKHTIQLLISDVMMPEISGFVLCQKIKTDLQSSHIPVILLTAKDNLNSKIEGLEVGADAYISKPFSMEYLKAHIENLIENRKNLMDFYSSSPLSHLKSVAHSQIDETFIKKTRRNHQ